MDLDRTLTPAEELAILTDGELELRGRILPASNLTFLADVTLDGRSAACVYKPISGERPLWDFPDGTLAAREVAAYAVSEALGWGIVPLTLLREGPAGTGMVQVWREPDPDQEPVDLVPVGEVPTGFVRVLDAYDGEDRPVSLVHEESVALRRMAVFDAVVNNADRKGGHILAMADGHRYGVDHGVSFHEETKLRTVLWGWAGQPLHPDDAAALAGLQEALHGTGSTLPVTLRELLSADEVAALGDRCDRLVSRGRMPVPSSAWPAIPWPAF